MSASVCLKVFHIIYKVSLKDMGKAALPTPLPRNLCIFLQVLPGNSVKCYLKEIKVPNIHERQRFSPHSLHPYSLPKNLQN